MATYTGRQRVSAAFKKTFSDADIKLDRIPAYPIIGAHNAQLIGASIRQFLLDPKIFVKAQVASAVYPLKVGLSFSEAPASCSLISPKIYREFIFPYHKQIADHFKGKKVGTGLHICGYADPIIEDMVNTGMTNLSIDAPSDLAGAIALTRGKAVLIGNIDTNLFFSGTRQDMERAIENCIALAPDDSGYILSSGCEVPGVAPPEKVAWFMEIVNELCVKD